MANNHKNKSKSENEIFEAGFKSGIGLMALTLDKSEDPKKFLNIIANDDNKLKEFTTKLYSEFVSLYKESKNKGE